MYSSQELWLAAVIALAAGIAIGVLATRFLRRGSEGRSDAVQQLRDLQEQQQQYRHNVTEHFSRTAELLAQLAGDYRNVHNHLAQGAQSLCDPSALKALTPLTDDASAQGQQRPTLIEQPRDYALRNDAYNNSGTLAEDFGLEKQQRPVVEPPRY